MEPPIFELEIVNDIMHTMRKVNIGFYQRELSYSHCDISNQLEAILYSQKTEEDKKKYRMESLPFCNGEYMISLLKKLRGENIVYASYATQIFLHQFYTIYASVVANPMGSVFEQLISRLETYIQMYNLDEKQLYFIFDFELRSLLENYDNQKIKQKEDTSK